MCLLLAIDNDLVVLLEVLCELGLKEYFFQHRGKYPVIKDDLIDLEFTACEVLVRSIFRPVVQDDDVLFDV